MSVSPGAAPYAAFGQLLAQLRARAGIGKQAELAKRLGTTQQTVSRWERGLSRPRDRELSLIASVLAADQDILFEAAGYAPSTEVATFDRPFPVNALPPESFERFCAYLLERLYRAKRGQIHRAGGSGHRQDGIDISVTGPFGRHTFQCKRVEEFGPQRVRAAVAKQTVAASQKVLLLSNIASPQARAVLADHPDWQIWDREDISLRVRSLALAEQRELIDTFFRGKRLELLGEAEPGPWMTGERFFAPFVAPGRLFNHNWKLVGLADEAAAVAAALRDDAVLMTMLVAPAGSGKTRLLRHVIDEIERERRGARIWFLSPTEDVTARHLDQLGGGSKLLVVDDAHDRDDLGVVIRYCATPENRARLLIALRPYGRESVRYQAASLSLSGSHVRDIEMRRPTKEDAEALASEVLAACDGPLETARDIATATRDSPLATVVGAQLVAREQIHPLLLVNVQDFQTLILARLQDVIAGEIVTGPDVDRVQGVLRVVSLVQPILIDEPALLSLLRDVEQIEQPDAARLMRTLTEAGVLFRRGLRYRLSPDLLADSIIIRHCIKQDGTSTGYMERVFDHAQRTYLKNLLINVGRLDWRLRQGDTTESRLLEGVWHKLEWKDAYVNPHVEAAAAVAYYQPRMALTFARRLIDEGHGGDANVCEMLKYAAYNFDFLDEACALLWKAGQDDPRPLHQHPRHAIRILQELAAFEPNKPAEYIARVVDFAIAVVDAPGALTKPHTPFVVLESALAAEGHSTVASNRRAITLSPFTADRQVVADVREHVISTLLAYIEGGPPRQAFLAARAIGEALRGPIGILGLRMSIEESEAWQQEHARTLDRVAALLARHRMHPVVLVRAAESVAWHAFHDVEQCNGANTILSLLDRDIDTRLVRALIDGWGQNTWRFQDDTAERRAYESDVSALIADMAAAFDTPPQLSGYVERWLRELSEVAGPTYGAPHVIVNRLISEVPGLAHEILARYRHGSTSPLNPYAGVALSAVLRIDSDVSRTTLRVLLEETPEALRMVAQAYACFDAPLGYSEDDLPVLRAIFRSKDRAVLRQAGQVALQVARQDRPLAVELICSVDLVAAGDASHDLFMWLSHGDTIPREFIGVDQWRRLLRNLEPLPELDDHWIREFLKNALREMPDLVIAFLKNRLERAAVTEGWAFFPLRRSLGRGDGLGLLDIAGGATHMRPLFEWALQHVEDGASLYRFGQAVAGLCGTYDKEALRLLMLWIGGGTAQHARVVAAVLHEAQNDLIFSHPQFVRDVLNAAQSIGPEAVNKVSGALYTATNSGVRSTSPGDPFPEDVKLENHATIVLSTLSRWDPAFELFTALLRGAKASIASQHREREVMDAEEEES
jgi:transcriptional regulator with XRE-family HTH domain